MSTQGRPGVLLVDDRPEKLLAMESLLADMPIELIRASSGREALRHILRREFALILLDVNMPGLDGLETAALIRARKNSEHIPIIFITAHGDEIFMERGYSLGAVDYILQPVVPEILRAKVSVFVDLFLKTAEIKLQSEAHRRRASQLQRLAQVSLFINASSSVERIIELTADSLSELIGAGKGSAYMVLNDDDELARLPALSPHHVASAERNHALSKSQREALQSLLSRQKSIRINSHDPHPEVAALVKGFPYGLIAARLTGSDERIMGFVAVPGRSVDVFSEDDEAILVLLSQMASIAIENTHNAEARNANRAKDQFLAVLSHELRTPLMPVLATLSQIDSDQRIPGDVLDEFKMIRRNVELEARLIDDLLDLTRISKGKIELHLNSVDAHALIHDALNICKSDIAEKSLVLRTDLAAKRSHIRGDFARLHQVLWNLLKNAVKFTASAGAIEVFSEDAPDGTLIIRIIDTGIGIEPDVLPRIFNAFEQGKRSITRQFGGLGLGLTITKALVEAHHGSITASSPGTNLGATFTLTLPLDTSYQGAPPITPSNPLLTSLQPLRILLVEDHPDTGRVMARLLTHEAHHVTLTQTVREALNKYDSDTFDLVISDIGLPDGSGLDLMRTIQSRRPVRSIALSGFGMDEDIGRSRDAGFHEHLTKPVDFPKLLHCIERIMLSEKLAEAPADPTPV